jgi:hypothetical protein
MCRAAYALHSACFKWQLLASFDADLQWLVNSWPDLSMTIRRVLMGVIELQE